VLRALVVLTLTALAACGRGANDGRTVVTFSGSVLGAEGAILSRHVAAFEKANPDVHVVVQRTPDDATQRHQLYVQWLNARAGDPDVLQLDVIWTPEFAAAGWIMPLTRWHPDTAVFYPSTIAANLWRGELYALPWFMDVDRSTSSRRSALLQQPAARAHSLTPARRPPHAMASSGRARATRG
jgi:multiple sugar transport system substrate-binding protein